MGARSSRPHPQDETGNTLETELLGTNGILVQSNLSGINLIETMRFHFEYNRICN